MYNRGERIILSALSPRVSELKGSGTDAKTLYSLEATLLPPRHTTLFRFKLQEKGPRWQQPGSALALERRETEAQDTGLNRTQERPRPPASRTANCRPGRMSGSRRGRRFPRARTNPSRLGPRPNLVSPNSRRRPRAELGCYSPRSAQPSHLSPLTRRPRPIEASGRRSQRNKKGKKRGSRFNQPGGCDEMLGRRVSGSGCRLSSNAWGWGAG